MTWSRVAGALRPPPQVPLSEWIEATIKLPQGLAAEPGAIKLWPWQRAIADAVADNERVTVIKAARIGYTSLLDGITAHYCVNEPSAILLVLPREQDARDHVVTNLEQTFAASGLGDILGAPGKGANGRALLTHRPFDGGSLRVVSSHTPRNLRRIAAKVLLIDEVDSMENVEGDIVSLAEKRTLSFADRRIVVGSTPLLAETSKIAALYRQSDMRVWELPCPHCREFFELRMEHLHWTEGAPETAHAVCPSCGSVIEEADKPAMVEAGRWRSTAPHVKGHAGFRLNALTSLLPNASWGRIALEKEQADAAGPEKLQTFHNLTLGEPWSGSVDTVEEDDLAKRAEPFSLDALTSEIIALTSGTDCADDRLETVVVGWDRNGTPLVLSHQIAWGPIDGEEVWRDLDELLKSRWQHPRGGRLGIDAALVDCGDGGHYDRVLSFTMPRLSRRVFASKGAFGVGRAIIQPTKSRVGNRRLLIVGVDGCKQNLFAKLERGTGIRFSASLEPVYYEQLCSEVRTVAMSRGRPVIRFVRKPGALAECLDATVLAIAARAALRLNVEEREAQLSSPIPPTPRPPAVVRSSFVQTGRA